MLVRGLRITQLSRLFAILSMAWWLPGLAHAEWLIETREHMGTTVTVELWSDDPVQGHESLARVFAEIDAIDVMMNPWNPNSELSAINRRAAAAPYPVSAPLMQVIDHALQYSVLSDGAFDISFASVGQHYDYREGVQPNNELVARDLGAIDYRAIDLDREAGTIAYQKAGLQIDLGGIAKGYAVDRGIQILQADGVVSAVVSAGGDSRILGDLGDRPRTIGIRHPRKKDEFAVMIPLQDVAISTSGDYERFFMADGQRVHHILDPGTGHSAQSVQSASVMAPLAIDSDALSTTVFVLGVERGLALINDLPDVDAIIIDADGKLHYSAELLLNTKP